MRVRAALAAAQAHPRGCACRRATLAQPAPLSTAWHLHDGAGGHDAGPLGAGDAQNAPVSSVGHTPFAGLAPSVGSHQQQQQQQQLPEQQHQQQQGHNMDALCKQIKPPNEQVLQAWQYIHSRVNGE